MPDHVQDWANPKTRDLIHVYPEIESSVGEFRQAEKWAKECPLDDLSPMWCDFKRAPNRHFYVNELCQLQSGAFVIPLRWVIKDGKECGECHPVKYVKEKKEFVVDSSTKVIEEASNFERNFEHLERLQSPLMIIGKPSSQFGCRW